MIKKALPIWTDTVTDNQYIEVKQEFDFHGNGNVKFQIYADADYDAYINGRYLGAGQYRMQPNKRAYDEYDVTDMLVNGKNTVCVTAYHQGKDSSTYCRSTAAVAFALFSDDMCVMSGKDTLVREHPFYESGDIEMISGQLGYTFHYDATKPETQWQEPNIIDLSDVTLVKRPISKLSRKELVKGKIKTQGLLMRTTEGTPADQMQKDFLAWRPYGDIFSNNTVKYDENGAYFVIDLGDELGGYFSMTINAAKGTVIDIGFGEHLDDMRVRTSVGRRNFAARYIANGSENEHFSEHMRRFGCRYLEIHITSMSKDVEFKEIGLVRSEYPLARIADFKCNDYFFEKLYDTSVKTLRMCMHEHYEDCPWREQALYAYDSYIQMLCGYYAFGEYEFARASLELLADTQTEDGLLGLTAPRAPGLTIPVFSLAWILSLEKYTLFSGDTEFARSMLNTAEKILSSFDMENGLVKNKIDKDIWHFKEWSAGLDGNKKDDCDHDSPTNFYYILALEAYRSLCGYCKVKAPDIDIDKIRDSIKEMFYDSEKGLYKTAVGDGRYHEMTQTLAVMAGMPNTDEMLEKIASKDSGLIPSTLSSLLFKYEALLKNSDKYKQTVLDDMRKVYGDMMFRGADTLWETSKGACDFSNAGSLCHAWSAVWIYIVFKYYIGFKPTLPGFESYEIEPMELDDPMHFKATLLSPKFEKQYECK